MRKIVVFILAFIVSFQSASASRFGVSSPQVAESNMARVAQLPFFLDFAGENVPLEYPDIKSSLERELIVDMYMHSRTIQTLMSTKRYFAIIEPILKKNGVPNDFKYLCLAESGLNTEAVSSARAAGLWQFMPGTANGYGMECGSNVDMRFHVEQATIVACQYFLESYRLFGNWTLTAASYNIGRAGVSRRMKQQQQSDYYDMFFPAETMRYIHRILAFKLICNNPKLYGFDLREADYLKPFVNYTLQNISDSNIDWPDFAKKRGTSYKMLRLLNPWIRSYTHPNADSVTYTVLVPTPAFRKAGH